MQSHSTMNERTLVSLGPIVRIIEGKEEKDSKEVDEGVEALSVLSQEMCDYNIFFCMLGMLSRW